MSMISAQIDELRKAAEYYDDSEVASIMRYAADTIWQLRDDLQRANAAVQDAEHDESMAWDSVRKLEAENAKLWELGKQHEVVAADYRSEIVKLRKLVADMWRELDAATQYDAGGGRGIVHEFDARMRELGVEVDDG